MLKIEYHDLDPLSSVPKNNTPINNKIPTPYIIQLSEFQTFQSITKQLKKAITATNNHKESFEKRRSIKEKSLSSKIPTFDAVIINHPMVNRER